jgi:hypothetical protein
MCCRPAQAPGAKWPARPRRRRWRRLTPRWRRGSMPHSAGWRRARAGAWSRWRTPPIHRCCCRHPIHRCCCTCTGGPSFSPRRRWPWSAVATRRHRGWTTPAPLRPTCRAKAGPSCRGWPRASTAPPTKARLKARGSTVAVVGTGAGPRLSAAAHELARRIAAEGLLLSEFCPGTPPLPTNFPQRNRIIAGLARGHLVVEAALRSGSLITARLAAEHGREVFAVPGLHPLAAGSGLPRADPRRGQACRERRRPAGGTAARRWPLAPCRSRRGPRSTTARQRPNPCSTRWGMTR